MVSLTILGSTGSIGVSTLDVVRQNRDRWDIYSLVAGRNVERLLSQIQEFRPKIAVLADEIARDEMAKKLAESGLERRLWPQLETGNAAKTAVSVAPEVGAVKTMLTPEIGFPEVSVTATSSGATNAVRTAALCGVPAIVRIAAGGPAVIRKVALAANPREPDCATS